MAGQLRRRKASGGHHARVFGASVRLAATGLGWCWLIAASSAPLAETVYKWIDGGGITHYGHRPPPAGIAAQEMELSAEPTRSAAEAPGYEERLERINRRLQVYEEERRTRNERDAEARRANIRRDQQCARLSARARDYETTGGTWYEPDSQGNRHYLDDRQMADRIRRIHAMIGKHCR